MTTLPSDRFMQISAVVLKNYDDIHLNTPMLKYASRDQIYHLTLRNTTVRTETPL